MINKLFLLFILISLLSCSQNPNTKTKQRTPAATYTLPFPPGWNTEIFLLPPTFASGIAYKGIQDVRFAPGWSKPGDNEYWTYCFLWCLDDSVKIDAGKIEANLKAYYTGLVASNIQKTKVSTGGIIETETAFEKVTTDSGDAATFKGTIRMFDYMKQEPITLNCIARLKFCQQQTNTYLFYEISPKSFTDSVWKNLDLIWSGFMCNVSK